MIIIDDSNFILFAAKYYKLNNSVDVVDFEEDIQRFKYIKKCFYLIKNKKNINIQIIFNHLNILYNVFDEKALYKMLFFKLGDYLDILIPCLLHINKPIPNRVQNLGIDNMTIYPSDIPLDLEFIEVLRKNGKVY